MSTGTPHLLELRSVGVEFKGVKALKDVSLSIGSGQWVGVIGPNGSGKTTLMNAIMGVYRLAHGEIIFDGTDISSAGPISHKRTGLVRSFQHDQLASTLTLAENVALSMLTPLPSRPVQRWLGRERRTLAAATEALEKVGCGWYATRIPREAPQGVRRLAGIARAIFAEGARLLLLDEPAAGLSEAERASLQEVLADLRNSRPDLAVLLIEHDIKFIAHEAPRLIGLDAGAKIGDGPADEVLGSDQVSAAFLGKVIDA